jgi:hypothetical protein
MRSRDNITGHIYLERGKPVVVLIPGAARARATVVGLMWCANTTATTVGGKPFPDATGAQGGEDQKIWSNGGTDSTEQHAQIFLCGMIMYGTSSDVEESQGDAERRLSRRQWPAQGCENQIQAATDRHGTENPNGQATFAA